MKCAEFQKALPYIIDTGGDPEHEEHLKACDVCHDLVMDLKYIADQAKLLVPMEDPPKRVWEGIQQSLQREGFVPRPTGHRGRLLGPFLVSVLGLAVVISGLVLYNREESGAASLSAPASTSLSMAAPNDHDDQQVLTAVADQAPSLRAVYAESLQRVNAYIEAARQRVAQDPRDEQARQHLMQAYTQKTMLYQMALQQAVQ